MKKNTKKNPMVGKEVWILTYSPTSFTRYASTEVFTSRVKAVNEVKKVLEGSGYFSCALWEEVKSKLMTRGLFYRPDLFVGDKIIIDSATIR